jgi:hypothetical protein
MCVAVPHGLFAVSDHIAKQLHMYSLIDGTLIRSIGSKGTGKGQFGFTFGGLCTSPDGDSVLVAEWGNDRVQEVRIVDGSWVRFVGEGVLKKPQYVDCNADVIAVSESSNDRISVLSWADGSVRAQFSSCLMNDPRGLRLFADGSGVVVVDMSNHRLCVFALSGEFVAVVGSDQGLCHPHDVLECASDGSFIVANWRYSLVKSSQAGVTAGVYGQRGDGNGDGEFDIITALAALPNDGCLVVHYMRVQHLTNLQTRLAWMRACVGCMTRIWEIK